MGTYTDIDGSLESSGMQVDRVRSDLYRASIALLDKGTKDLWRGVHASAFVYLSATLEDTVKRLLTATIEEINAMGLLMQQVRESLFALAGDPQFASIRTSKPLAAFERRVQLMEMIRQPTQCALNSVVLPLDGRTLRPEHFDLIWSVFGFPGSSLPGPRHRLAIVSLADIRNEIAHGETDPIFVARRERIEDTIKLVKVVEQVILHLYSAINTYLDGKMYERSV